MEEVAEGASEGTSEGSSLDGRQRRQRGRRRQSEQSAIVVVFEVLGRSRGTSGRLFFFSFSVLGLVRGPVEGQRFVGSGTVGGQKIASRSPFLVLQGQQLVVLFLGAGMHGQGAAQTRSR